MLDNLLTALRAVAEPTRLRLVALCASGEWTVSELVQVLGQSQPRVSRHLKLLCDAGVLERHREGSWVFHRLARDGEGALVSAKLMEMLPDVDGTLKADQDRLQQVKNEREQAAANYFRINASRWGELRSLYVDEGEVEKALAEMLARHNPEKLLDIGTGTGRMLELFGAKIVRGVGIDRSTDMLALARSNLEKAGLDNCEVRQGDLYQIPYDGRSFDTVLIHQVLHFVDDPDRAIREAARVLKPGGRMLVVDFAPHDLENLRSDHEHRRLGFSQYEMKNLYDSADMELENTVNLPGQSLTVCLWLARKK